MDFVKYIINCFKVYYPKFLCEWIVFIQLSVIADLIKCNKYLEMPMCS